MRILSMLYPLVPTTNQHLSLYTDCTVTIIEPQNVTQVINQTENSNCNQHLWSKLWKMIFCPHSLFQLCDNKLVSTQIVPHYIIIQCNHLTIYTKGGFTFYRFSMDLDWRLEQNETARYQRVDEFTGRNEKLSMIHPNSSAPLKTQKTTPQI